MIRKISFLVLFPLLGLFSAGATKPKLSFNVRAFGATGNGTTKDTAAFQKALDTCAVSGGGEVVVNAGKYLIGSIQMGNRTILRLEKDSVLMGSPDLADYPIMDVRWEGRWQPGHRALIYSANVDHTGIIGPGRIEGNRAVAFGKEMRGAPVLEPISCTDLRWEGFSVITRRNVGHTPYVLYKRRDQESAHSQYAGRNRCGFLQKCAHRRLRYRYRR